MGWDARRAGTQELSTRKHAKSQLCATIIHPSVHPFTLPSLHPVTIRSLSHPSIPLLHTAPSAGRSVSARWS
jgi:hypothetical protein